MEDLLTAPLRFIGFLAADCRIPVFKSSLASYSLTNVSRKRARL